MKVLNEFKIPIIGMRQDHYQFDFQIDKSFFEAFDEPLYTNGDLKVTVMLNKQVGMIELDFIVKGKMLTECDRCLADIYIPVADEQHLIVKYSEEEQLEEDEIVYIHPDTPVLDLSQYVYEYICLAVPFIKTYDCEAETTPPCDQAMLAYLSKDEGQGTVYDETDDDAPSSSIWDDLKNKLN